MKNFFLEESSSILLAKMARVDLDETTPKRDLSAEEDNIIVPSVHGETYRLFLKPGPLFCCSETGIKFQVKCEATIEYELEYGLDYMKQIKDNGYELVGPLFNITVKTGVVSSVHLPHYLYLEDLGGDKSSIKYGHIKDDGKIHFLKPTKIESSYIVLENPTFSLAGVVFRISSLLNLRKKSIKISGKVLLYFCVLSPHREDLKEYRTHLYLVPCKRAELSKLDDQKEKKGFKRIDKPSIVTLIVGHIYKVGATGPDPKILPKDLLFKTNTVAQDLPFAEINVKGNATSITLKLTIRDVQEPVWTGELTGADLEDQSVMARKSKKTDDPGQHFVMKHRPELIQKINPIGPVIDDLLQKKFIMVEVHDKVRNIDFPQEQMRELYDSVNRWENGQMDTFYDVLKKHYPKVIKNLAHKS